MNISKWNTNINYSNKTLETENLKFINHSNLVGVFVKEITYPDHILYGEKGLFSRRYWKKFEIIGNYTGVLSEKNEGKYLAKLYHDDSYNLCIDGEYYGNELRYINDYRNIKNTPNCKFISSIIDGKQQILVVVIEDIPSYNEVLIDYGYDYCSHYNIKPLKQ